VGPGKETLENPRGGKKRESLSGKEKANRRRAGKLDLLERNSRGGGSGKEMRSVFHLRE